MLIRRALTLLLLSFLVLGCASQAQHLRSQPVVYMDITNNPNRTVEVLLPPIPETPPPAAPDAKTVAIHENRSSVEVAALSADGILAGTAALTTNAAAPVTTTPAVRGIAFGTGETVKLVVHCVRTPEFYNKDRTSSGQCLYQSIDYPDVQNLPVHNQAERNRMIDVLVGISNDNCATYRDRVLANKAALDTVKNSGKDIAAGLAAGTVKTAAGFSAGLGLFNLIGGSVLTNFDQAIFSEKGFPGILAAIDSERAVAETTLNMNRRKKFDEYSYQAALNDVKKYDRACSITAAVEHLATLAELDRAKQTAGSNKLDQLLEELDNTGKQRAADQELLKQAQKKLIDATDPKQREALETAIRDLREQVAASTKEVRTLESSIHTASTPADTPAQNTPPPAAPAPAAKTTKP